MDELLVRQFGPGAFLIRFAREVDERALDRCRGILHHLEKHPLVGTSDLVPAYGEILVEFGRPITQPELVERELMARLKGAKERPAEEARLHEIPVRYDGPDLEELAETKGLQVDEVIEIHARGLYHVYQIGFSPGFPYLGPLDERLHMPRLANPRPTIAAGSVAIGGEHTGIYSIPSGGGWRLIGRTEVELFVKERGDGAGSEGAFLLRQGDRVKFVPII